MIETHSPESNLAGQTAPANESPQDKKLDKLPGIVQEKIKTHLNSLSNGIKKDFLSLAIKETLHSEELPTDQNQIDCTGMSLFATDSNRKETNDSVSNNIDRKVITLDKEKPSTSREIAMDTKDG